MSNETMDINQAIIIVKGHLKNTTGRVKKAFDLLDSHYDFFTPKEQ